MEKHFVVRDTLRSTCCCAVRYFGGDFLGAGQLWDLSMKGSRISGNFPVTLGAELILYIQLPQELGDDWYWIDKAVVRWVAGDNFGIEIQALTPGSRTFLAYALGEFDAT